jgi:hypothetical protein
MTLLSAAKYTHAVGLLIAAGRCIFHALPLQLLAVLLQFMYLGTCGDLPVGYPP